MKRKLIFTTLMLVLGCIGLCSCVNKELEKKLDGTWRMEETETEDGVTMKMISTESFDYDDHTFEATLEMHILDPMYMNVGTVTYSGKWSIHGNQLINKVDKESLTFNFSSSLDESDKREAKREMLRELEKNDYVEGFKFTSDITDYFTAKDDDGELYRYERVKQSYASSFIDTDSGTDEKTMPEIVKPVSSHKNVAEETSSMKKANLPSWVNSEILNEFSVSDLSIKPYEWMRDNLFRSLTTPLNESVSYYGSINEYSITARMTIMSSGAVSGKYAYNSTLQKYGDGKDRWFTFDGNVVFDDNDTPFIILKDKNPQDGKLFEYILLEYQGDSSWSGKMFNRLYLIEPNHKIYNFELFPEAGDY